MGKALVRVVDVLGYFEMAFAAAGARVVERMRDTLQLILIGQMMRDAAERINDAVILAAEDLLSDSQQRGLLLEVKFDRQLFAPTLGLQFFDFAVEVETLAVSDRLLGLDDEVIDPRADGLDD